MLSRHDTRATFFVLGWVAERHPALIKRIAQEGHEIASHGYGHELITTQTPDRFREDVRRAKRTLEDLIGKRVLGYRAPSFSIADQTLWALSVLVEEGYLYDSSIYRRFRRSGHGCTDSASLQRTIQTPAGPIKEVPPSTVSVIGLHLPVAGGGYFRLIPYQASRLLLRRLEKQGGRLVMYLHPWEIDPEQPRMDGPLRSRLRHYWNLRKTEERLRQLLQDFRFGPICDTVASLSRNSQSSADLNGAKARLHKGERLSQTRHSGDGSPRSMPD
jgi:polysaccharide deacetylase family protein (PEP-CTERM system associated)